jgi:hypothetical protein
VPIAATIERLLISAPLAGSLHPVLANALIPHDCFVPYFVFGRHCHFNIDASVMRIIPIDDKLSIVDKRQKSESVTVLPKIVTGDIQGGCTVLHRFVAGRQCRRRIPCH